VSFLLRKGDSTVRGYRRLGAAGILRLSGGRSRVWHASKHHGGVVITDQPPSLFESSPTAQRYRAQLLDFMETHAYPAEPVYEVQRVNAVAPGVVRTKLSELLWREHEQTLTDSLPLARIGEPEDVGWAIAFLASDAAAWITGQTLVIDGGALL
jgi:NAD(P)-dependent dehydrogenase (short-subunit alcohol dehydrogenase family)